MKDIEKNTISNQIAGELVDISVEKFIYDNALPYAHYTIMDRALINEDGLKPVNRRALYVMEKLGAKNGRTIKAQTISGYTVGNFHPHGDASVSSAIARMAQWFSLRIPLLDFQGNVGFQTGDDPAAPRYWEATLSKAGYELVKDLAHNTVEMKRNFIDTEDEPVNLPIRWPVGIINGTQGIAVGYASNIPPHNPIEIMDACVARLQGKISDKKTLMKFIKGPDFPTGGEIVGSDGIEDYLTTGSGTFVIRGKYKIEELSRGRHIIRFYELPYQISAEKVIEKIKYSQQKGKLKEISESKDLSDRKKGLNLCVFTKSGTNPQEVVNELFKLTPCEVKFSVNSTVLLDGRPSKVGMIELLDQFLIFKKSCFVKGLENKLSKLKEEMNKLSGILIIIADLDKAIEIIKKSETSEEASESLQKAFKVNQEQAEHILQMRLRSLTKADKEQLLLKNKELQDEITKINEILSDEVKLVESVVEDLELTKKTISDKRRTVINNITHEELSNLEKEDKKMLKLLSKNIDCKLIVLADNSFVKLISEDEMPSFDLPIKDIIEFKSQEPLFIIKANGEIVEINTSAIQLSVNSKLSLFGINELDFVCFASKDKKGIFVVTNLGNVNITRPNYKTGTLVTLIPGEYIIFGKDIKEEDLENKNLFILSKDGIITSFPLNQVRISGQGSGLIAGGKAGIYVSAILADKLPDGTSCDIIVSQSNNTIKVTTLEDVPIGNRASKGVILQRLNDGDVMKNLFVKNKVLDKNLKEVQLPEISLRTNKGTKFNTELWFGI